jgi:hypothetical protein
MLLIFLNHGLSPSFLSENQKETTELGTPLIKQQIHYQHPLFSLAMATLYPGKLLLLMAIIGGCLCLLASFSIAEMVSAPKPESVFLWH